MKEETEEAGKRMLSGKKQMPNDPSANLSEGSDTGKALVKAAKKIGVSENTARDMITIVEQGTEELQEDHEN